METEHYFAPKNFSGCSKTELAQAYFPNTMNPDTARRNLSRWIKMNPELTTRLQETGYRERQRIFTPLQLNIIFSILGEP